MAGDWIRVESATPNKPEVMKLARLLNVTRDDAFGKAMRFWLWLDGVSVDGRVDGVTSHDVDAVVGAPGFSEALEIAGWLEIDDSSQKINVPNFDRHNGESAKARGLKAKRQAKWRANRVDGAASTKASPEKRREEKKERSPLTPQGENGNCAGTKQKRFTDLDALSWPNSLANDTAREALAEWVEYKASRGQAYRGTHGPQKILNEFEPIGPEGLRKAINHSIANNYAGVFSTNANSLAIARGPVKLPPLPITDGSDKQ